jgi:hypothetical protein
MQNSFKLLAGDGNRVPANKRACDCTQGPSFDGGDGTMAPFSSPAQSHARARLRTGLAGAGVAAALAAASLVFAGEVAAADAAKPIPVSDTSFKCITEMKPVRHFYVDNLLGNVAATVAVAEKGSGDYPVGSVLQLVPNEVMIKQPKGFSPPTRDWEFFFVDVSEQGSKIYKRGFAEVNNRFGGNCFACHVKAKPEFDFVCEKDHG